MNPKPPVDVSSKTCETCAECVFSDSHGHTAVCLSPVSKRCRIKTSDAACPYYKAVNEKGGT